MKVIYKLQTSKENLPLEKNVAYLVVGLRIFQAGETLKKEVSVILPCSQAFFVFDLDKGHITDSKIPPDWIFWEDMGEMYLSPAELKGENWWKFHDEDWCDDLNEPQIVLRTCAINKIYTFHGLDPLYEPEPTKPEPLKENDWWKEY